MRGDADSPLTPGGGGPREAQTGHGGWTFSVEFDRKSMRGRVVHTIWVTACYEFGPEAILA